MSAAVLPVASDLDRFLETIWRDGDVREVRILAGPRGTDSGYFDDTAKLSSAVQRYDGRDNVYITINPVAPPLLARAANRIVPRTRTTTADTDVLERRWLPIDLDPKRPTGISASDVEREHALATARAIYAYLHALDWPDPVTTMSGNGYWLLYPIELPNDDASRDLVAGVLGHLAGRFGSSTVSIDTTVANAARIVALIGTLKVKGDATPERPHRRSELTFRPDVLTPVPRKKLAALGSSPTTITVEPAFIKVGRMPAGWVGEALRDRGIAYREIQRSGRTWYLLDQCPFHPDDDQGGDCGVGEDAEGKALGKCFHNRGQGKGWQEFKAALELETKIMPLPVARPEPATPAMKGMDAADLLELDLPPLRWIVPDLIPEGTTILAAPPKVGKSCFVYQVAVEASIGGDLLGRRVAAGSVLYMALEDGKRRGQDRLRAVLAGRTMPRGRLEVRWSVPPIGQGLEEEIAAWLDGHPDAALVAIDTLGKVRPPGGAKGRNAYEVDVEHLNRLQALFRDVRVALLIVHHSSKEKRDDFLASVSGTYGITGSVDTIVAIERKRSEAFGEIHVTGRDAPDSTVSARFDGLLWQQAPGWVVDSRFEQSETYRVLQEAGRPLFAKAIADALGITREAAQQRVKKLVSSGSVVRVEGGYALAGVVLDFVNPSSVPPSSLHPESKGRNAGESRARADSRVRDAPTLTVVPGGPSPTVTCHFPHDHSTAWRQVPDGRWLCAICSPDEEAS